MYRYHRTRRTNSTVAIGVSGVAAAVFVAAVFVAAVFVGVLASSTRTLSLFIPAMTWLLAALSVAYAYHRVDVRLRRPSPLAIMAPLIVIYGVIVPVVGLLTDNTNLDGRDVRAYYMAGILASGIALTSLAFGYAGPYPGRRERRLKARAGPFGNIALVALVACGAIVGTAWRFLRYGIGGRFLGIERDMAFEAGANGYVLYAPVVFGTMSLYMAFRSETRTAVRLVAAVLAVCSSIYYAVSGVRYWFVVYAGAAGLLIFWRRWGAPRLPLRWLACAAIAAVAVLGILGAGRAPTVSSVEDLKRAEIQRAAWSSFDIFNTLAGAIEYTDSEGYVLGDTYAYLVFQPIPRSVWERKPEPPLGHIIGSISDPKVGRAFPIWGEMWVNFGLPGVVLGMALLGYVIRRLRDTWWMRRQWSVTYDVPAALTMLLLVQWISRGYFVQLVHNSLAFLLGPLVLASFDSRVRRTRPSGH